MQPTSLSARVLLRLEQGEAREPNVHYRDDIRIAWLTCLYAYRSEPMPFVRATYTVLGVHPDEVFPHIQAQRRAKLAGEYAHFYDAEGTLIAKPSAPAKPTHSVSLEEERRRRKA